MEQVQAIQNTHTTHQRDEEDRDYPNPHSHLRLVCGWVRVCVWGGVAGWMATHTFPWAQMFCICRVEFWKCFRNRATSSVWVQIAVPAQAIGEESGHYGSILARAQNLSRGRARTQERHPLLLDALHVRLRVLQGRDQHLTSVHRPRPPTSQM